jgi:hypothetical protein
VPAPYYHVVGSVRRFNTCQNEKAVDRTLLLRAMKQGPAWHILDEKRMVRRVWAIPFKWDVFFHQQSQYHTS